MNPSAKLTSRLREYLRFDPEQLSIGLWSGNLHLSDVEVGLHLLAPCPICRSQISSPPVDNDQHNYSYSLISLSQHVQLREEMFDHPSFTMVSGTIGELQANIPWRTLMISTATVAISNVTIVLAPKSPDFSDASSKAREKKQVRVTRSPLSLRCLASSPIPTPLQQQTLLLPVQDLIAQASQYMDDHSTNQTASHDSSLQEISSLAAAAQSTVSKPPLTSRMVSSLASTLVARLISNLRASMSNVRVIIVQDTMSVGVTVESITLDNAAASFRFRGESSASTTKVRPYTLFFLTRKQRQPSNTTLLLASMVASMVA